MKKKIIAICLSVLIVVLGITACKSNKNGTPTISPTMTLSPSVSTGILPSGTGGVYPGLVPTNSASPSMSASSSVSPSPTATTTASQ